MMSAAPRSFAVIGTGLAGAACAHALHRAGHAVQVFDKSRRPGGRLATRHLNWTDREGRAHTTRLDHGALGLSARSAAFRAFLAAAVREGRLAKWAPRMASGPAPGAEEGGLYVPVPESPALCAGLLEGLAVRWSFEVEALRRGPEGWRLESAGESPATSFDAVVLAVPLAQAAPLLAPHRPDWARQAAAVAMQPGWTLMGVAAEPTPAVPWETARAPVAPLAWVLRNESRPGRVRVPGQAQWIVHATADWSRAHLEQPAEWVQAQLHQALEACLGQPVRWLSVTVHRWRYASAPAGPATLPPTALSAWWDADQGLGVCGDHLGGGGGEGAWLSAQRLCAEWIPDLETE